MGRGAAWKLPIVLVLVGTCPASASTKPASSSHRLTRKRGRESVAKAVLVRAFQDDTRIVPSILSWSRSTRLVSTVVENPPPSTTTPTTTTDSPPPTTTITHATTPDSTRSKGGALALSTVKFVAKVPPFLWSKLREQEAPQNAGYYYGLMPDTIFPYDSSRYNKAKVQKEEQLAMAETLSETLEEMKTMRKELQTMRREIFEMRKKITGEADLDFDGGLIIGQEVDPEAVLRAKQKRMRQFDRIGREVEKWARQILFEEDRVGNGWTEVPCNKNLRKKVNPNGSTTCYVNYMPDSRGKNAFPGDNRPYPMLKLYGTFDAPIEDVCTYLGQKEHMDQYNWILTEQRDLEEISPHSKICLATSPQVLFVKPREFVTYCSHRWLNDGSVVMINQACDHKDAPAEKEEGKGKACRGYALRGATFISPDPNDPQKTRMAFIAHAASGGDLPQWAVKTAIGAVAPIEPFRLYSYINDSLKKSKEVINRLKMETAERPSVPGRSKQPVGLAQIGFACFWPNGGGLLPGKLGGVSPQAPSVNDPSVGLDTAPTGAEEMAGSTE